MASGSHKAEVLNFAAGAIDLVVNAKCRADHLSTFAAGGPDVSLSESSSPRSEASLSVSSPNKPMYVSSILIDLDSSLTI